ncbi:hypothetical protein DOY81_013051 [Sarcophaga bullata]|nr:hypothetical protein DOY81_013051 [Sarcophaga bullata]
MKTFQIFLLNLCLVSLMPFISAELDAKEGRAIAECLDRFGGPTLENAQRLQRFKQWSDTYEEIPCFHQLLFE